MAFLPYVRVVARGVVDLTQTWSIGFSVANDGTATSAELLTYITAVDPLLITFFHGVAITNTMWDTATSYTSLKAYSYPAVGESTTQASIFSAGVTGTSGNGMPRQCAAVVSLRSGLGGRANRGRFFLPATSTSAVSTQGQMTLGKCQAVAALAKTLFDATNALSIGSSAAILTIASRDSGAHTLVTGLSVDSKIDTQRRRTDKIPALFNAATSL